MSSMIRMSLAGLAMTAVLVVGGCSSMKPGAMTVVQTDSAAPRAGNVYLLRGWIGVFSTGIDNLTRKINENGVRAHVFQDDQYKALGREIRAKYRNRPEPEPLVLVGHSYGADDVVRIARELAKDNIRVDLLVTLDPVTPPKVPSNVVLAVNLYQSNGMLDKMPFLRGVPLQPDGPGPTRLAQWDIRKDRTDLLEQDTDHFNIEKKGKIHDEVIRQVLEVCPPRPVWAERMNVGPTADAPVPGHPGRITAPAGGLFGSAPAASTEAK